MAQNFFTCDREQPLLLPPDLHDWLDEDHLAWFVIEAIEELDLDAFYASYRADGHGSKFAADASDSAIRTYERLAEEIVAEAGRIDAAEDELYGDKRGDELPEHVSTHNGRRQWLKEAKKRLDAERAAAEEKVPRSREQRLELCHRRLVEDWQSEHKANRAYEAWRARGIAADGSRRMAPDTTKPHEPPPKPDGKINTTDTDARRMKLGRNFIPAYNAQTVTTEDQIVVAADVTTEGG